MSGHLPRFSPDYKKKKPALPSLLSNIRNAQAVIGRAAADDPHERETRPLVGGGGGLSGSVRTTAPSNRPQISRSAPSASFSATLQNLSQHLGSQWRKRTRKKGHGVTVVPQSFFIAVGCFFFAFPLFFILFILARHAVFGDEEDSSSIVVHKHEVPAPLGVTHESGNDPLGINVVGAGNPEDEITMYNGLNHTSVHGDATIGAHGVEGAGLGIDLTTGGRDQEGQEIIGQDQSESESGIVSIVQTNVGMEDSTKQSLQNGPMHNMTREGSMNNMLASNEIKPGDDLKGFGGDNPKQAVIPSNNDLNDVVKPGSTFVQVRDQGKTNLQNSPVEKGQSKTHASSDQRKENSDPMVTNDAKLLLLQEGDG